MNPYEEAVERFNRAAENYSKLCAEAERLTQEAGDEYDQAQDNLRQYESKPGIPLPEYRTCPRHGWINCLCSGPPDYHVADYLISDEADDAIAEKQFEHRHITSDGTFADND